MAIWVLIITLFSTPVFAATISIVWEPSPSPDVVGYAVYYGHKSGEYSARIDTASQTIFTLQPVSGSNYYFVVTAYTENGLESLPSTEVAYEPNSVIPEILAGSFNGLFEVLPSQQSFGAFHLRKGNRDSFSGSVKLEGRSYGFSGRTDSDGGIDVAIKRLGTHPLVLSVNRDEKGQNYLTGTLTDGERVFQLTADRSTFHARTNVAPFVGKYTMALVGMAGEESTPGGIGFAAIKVLPNGMVQARGNLGDGKNFSSATFLSAEGMWPFYVAAYGRTGGFISGWLKLDSSPSESVQGDLNWVKPANLRDKYYPAGFTTSAGAIASKYIPPTNFTSSIIAISNGTVTLSGGELVSGYAKDVLVTGSKIVAGPGADKMSINIQKDLGVFSGSVQLPGFFGRTKFRGVLLQNRNAGYGLLFGNNQTGQMLLESAYQ